MIYVITIDTGTTNTRLHLMADGRYVTTEFVAAGARNTAFSGSTEPLTAALKNGLKGLLDKNGLRESDIACIAAGGMIGSELGLHYMPHLRAPAGLDDLADAVERADLPHITAIPLYFIPGIKNGQDAGQRGNLDDMDMMRGEEIELLGILKMTGLKGPLLCVLPGSHTKIVRLNDRDQIVRCYTTLCGEIISSVSQNTILKQCLSPSMPKSLDTEYLRMGYENGLKNGFNFSAFRTRILDMFGHAREQQLLSFLVGTVLENDIALIKKICGNAPVYIGGSNPLKQAYAALLDGLVQVDVLDDDVTKRCTAYGAYAILDAYRRRCGQPLTPGKSADRKSAAGV